MRPSHRLAVLLLVAQAGALAWPQTPASVEPSPPTEVSGRLTKLAGADVLELWGSPPQAAYAQGFLTAPRIVALFDEYILDPRIVRDPAVYEVMLRPVVRRQFAWSAAQLAEFEALLRGMRDRLGQECRSTRLERSIELEDLMVANTIADWYGMFCSSVSVWGRYTADGQTLTARNLDYPGTASMERNQLIVVRQAHGDARGWVGVGWPGALGVYTAMNDQGVTMLMHDAAGLAASYPDGFTPRSFVLREALEAARAESYVGDVARVFARHRVLVGNNVHVSAPRRDALPPAVIFEYDGNREGDGFVCRKPGDDHVAPCADALWCTNHMRLRKPAVESRRFTALAQALARLADESRTLDPRGAFELIDLARQDTTVHTVVLEPARRRMHVRLPLIAPEPIDIRLEDWLGRRSTPPAAAGAGAAHPTPTRGGR